MGHHSVQQSPFTPVLMTGCHKDIQLHQALLLIIRLIIVDEKTKKIMTDLNISNLLQCLGGTITHQTVLDHTGKSYKRMIITYDVKEKND